MRIAILGYGEQGRAAYEYWRSPDNTITICDVDHTLELPTDMQKRLGNDYLAGLDQFDLIVRSPSIHPADIVKANGVEIQQKVTTVTNEFMKVCPTKNIVGVTGTKGKGTTSTLIAKMLEAAGKRVHLGGNIGTPPLDLLKSNIKPEDYIVLELANFQLIDIKYSPLIAVCLMVVPEHQDWHKNIEEYILAKQQLFLHQTTNDFAIYYGLNDYSQHIASVSLGYKIPYMKSPGADVIEGNVMIDGQTICGADELKLLGKHNWQNVCAAVTVVWQVTQDVAAIRSVLTTFTGLEHRLELVRKLDGVKYYDDSFGTVPETAIVAIEAFEEPKIVILGGSDKGADFSELAETVKKNNVKKAVLIGQTAPNIRAALERAGFQDSVDGGSTMDTIVNTARQHAQSGDVVILSTACASFDLFKNYKDRGEQFKAAVLALS
jgi:UDP-N-acetylmuramoylalanine--D-glutamate ligase